MNIKLDPINEQGTFDNDLYTQNDYTDIYNHVMNYIKLEGFNEVAGVYNLCLNNQLWVLRVS